MILRYLPLFIAILASAFLVGQLVTLPSSETKVILPSDVIIAAGQGSQSAPSVAAVAKNIIEKRPISPGERTVLTLKTTGLVDVVIFEEADSAELEVFRVGQVPRTAKVFTNIKELAYPLASQRGANFHIRIRHQTLGETTLHYNVGTSEQAMNQLRKGQNLVRNRGNIQVEGSLYLMPTYQLVPGTIVRVEPKTGKGTIALLKTMDYLAVRKGEKTLASLCTNNPCLQASNPKPLEVYLDDYDDRYLVAQAEAGSLEFSFAVIATPEVLNYIVSCG